ncbi:cytochrome c biogenesis protein ResB [Desulfobacca acetoxidans]
MLSRLWDGLTSIRLALLSLLLLAVVAIIGTLLPQGQSWEFYQERFGNLLGELFWRLGLFDVYRSPLFLMIIGLFMVNLTACSLKRLPEALRVFQRRPELEVYKILPPRLQFTLPVHDKATSERMDKALRSILGCALEVQDQRTAWRLYQRGRWGRLGPYLIHLSIMVIVGGGVIGGIWGYQGRMDLLEGQSANTLALSDSDRSRPLDFTVRLDRFQVDFYPNGSPREFRSDLTFRKSGQENHSAVCRVNHPVAFDGLSFYQSSYEALPRAAVKLGVQVAGRHLVLEAPLRRRLPLPDGRGMVMVLRLEPDLGGMGPALQLAYRSDAAGHPRIVWVLADRSQKQLPQPGPHIFSVEEVEITYRSGLLVKYDPGVWLVYLGFLLILPGCWLALFTPRQRWAVALAPQKSGELTITIHGVGDRHKYAFQRRLARLEAKLKEWQ